MIDNQKSTSAGETSGGLVKERQPPVQRRPFRTVPVDMGVPLVNIDNALDLASELDDARTLTQID